MRLFNINLNYWRDCCVQVFCKYRITSHSRWNMCLIRNIMSAPQSLGMRLIQTCYHVVTMREREGDEAAGGPRPVRRGGEVEQTNANPRSGWRDEMWVLRGMFWAWEGELFWASTCVLRNNSRRTREGRWLNYSVSSIFKMLSDWIGIAVMPTWTKPSAEDSMWWKAPGQLLNGPLSTDFLGSLLCSTNSTTSPL